MRISDWRSDVCSSDLPHGRGAEPGARFRRLAGGGSCRSGDDRGTAEGAGGRGRGGQGQGTRPRKLAYDRKVDPAPEPGSSLEGASVDPRRAPPGRPTATLSAEAADQRIKAGSICFVQSHAGK